MPQTPTETGCFSQSIATPTIITPPPEISSSTHWPPKTHNYRKTRRIPTVLHYSLAILAFLLIFSGLGFTIFISSKEYATKLHSLEATRERATRVVIASTNVSIQETVNTLNIMQAAIDASATAVEQINKQATATLVQATTTAHNFSARYKQGTNGQATFKDDLTQKADQGGWDTGQSKNVTSACTYRSGSYHATETNQGYLQLCIAQQTSFQDFIYQASVTVYKSNGGRAGLLFHINQANTSYYFFSINSTGSYQLDVCKTQEGCLMLGEGRSSSIRGGLKQKTLLSVMAQGQNYSLFANGEYLMSATDESLTSGKIGVAVLNINAPIDAGFQSVRIWSS